MLDCNQSEDKNIEITVKTKVNKRNIFKNSNLTDAAFIPSESSRFVNNPNHVNIKATIAPKMRSINPPMDKVYLLEF